MYENIAVCENFQVTNHLFETEEGIGRGFDLIALNIQRARDQGIPSYNDFREHCGLRRIISFDDPALGISQKAMAAVYTYVKLWGWVILVCVFVCVCVCVCLYVCVCAL